MALRAQGCRRGRNPGEGPALGIRRSFFAADCSIGNQAFGHQETVGCGAQCGMVMKATPASALVVTETEVLLQVLIVTLYAPALIGDANEFVDADVFGQCRQDVLARLFVASRPLDEQPLLGAQACLANIATRTAAKRSHSVEHLFPRQVMVCNACGGRDIAKAFTLTVCTAAVRRADGPHHCRAWAASHGTGAPLIKS